MSAEPPAKHLYQSAWIRAELNLCKHLRLPFSVRDFNGRVLDIRKSFSPDHSWAILLWKCFVAATCTFSIVLQLHESVEPLFTFAYITTWGVVSCFIYSWMSLLNSIIKPRDTISTQTLGCDGEQDLPSLKIRIAWVTFTLAVLWSAIATALFWGSYLWVEPNELMSNYTMLSTHGGLFVLVSLDGFLVNHIPLRLSHFVMFGYPTTLVWVVWSVIHAKSGIGNPEKADLYPETNDDAVYESIVKWNDVPVATLLFTAGVLFVVLPILTLVLWGISLPCCSP